jgi:hypothetical protein
MLFEVWLGDLSPDAANDGCVSEAGRTGRLRLRWSRRAPVHEEIAPFGCLAAFGAEFLGEKAFEFETGLWVKSQRDYGC